MGSAGAAALMESDMRVGILLCLAGAVFQLAAAADPYPSQPITIVDGLPVGAPADIALRRLGHSLEQRLGQRVLVRAQPGASGMVAARSVAQAAPDGYTLLFGVGASLASAPATRRHPPYDPRTAFTPVAEVAREPYVWLVRADLPVRSMAEFVAWARAHPAQINYGSPGIGSVPHLAAEDLQRCAGMTMTHVPFTAAGVYHGVLTGQVDALFDALPGPLPLLRMGKLRALAVTGRHRVPLLPEVPTLLEAGMADVPANAWWALLGPSGLPPDVVFRLNAEVRAALKDPAVVATFDRMGVAPSFSTPAALAGAIAIEYEHWRADARSLQIEID